jgi:hypothetical protein
MKNMEQWYFMNFYYYYNHLLEETNTLNILHNFEQNYTQNIANGWNLQTAKNANSTLHFYIIYLF